HVESPALTSLSEDAEREALELAPKLAETLRFLRARVEDQMSRLPAEPDVNASLLTPAVAMRLDEIADSMAMPPLAPISIATRTYSRELLDEPALSDEARALREAFSGVDTEERFVTQYAQLERRSAFDAAPSLAAVWAAVALRPLAQERVW